MAPPKTTKTQTVSSVTSIGERASAPDTHRLTAALQVTLELQQLIGIFSRGVYDTVPHECCLYRSPDGEVEIVTGHPGRHATHYDLTIAGESLGSITFSRQRRYAEHDLVQLEYLLCALVYPLRNALRFRAARQAAHKDPLTGIGNRAAMEEALEREIRLAERQSSELALLAIDLDHFKAINDRHGHTIGDAVLRAVVERMRAATRASDMLFRYGGEEFVALLSQTDEKSALLVAERIREMVAREPIRVGDVELPVSISIGVAIRGEEDSPRALFDSADHALYAAKRRGRNRVESFRDAGEAIAPASGA